MNKSALTRRFFESVVARLKELYESAVREIEGWLRALMTPVESQVKEHQAQQKAERTVPRRTAPSREFEERPRSLKPPLLRKPEPEVTR